MGQARISRVLGTMILAHVVMFVAGATQRNLLYLGAYGFTRVRLLGMALSIWIVAVAAMTLVKLWQNRNQDFLGKGLVLVTALAILGLNLANIDRMIVKYQPASLPTGIDYPYLAQLSDDAWEGWEKIVEEQIDQLKKGIDETRVIIDSKITREAINSREDRLKDLKSNYWNYGGGWNWASFNSERELKRIRAYERLDDAIKEAEVKMFQTIKLKNNELVVQRANQLAQYLINMKRDWRIIHPYKTEFKSNISRVEIGIETEGSMVENMYSELIGVINYQGGGMCQWGNSYLVNNQKYMSIISCEIGQ